MICENFKYPKLLEYFETISAIPRASYEEEKIVAYLLSFAKERGLSAYTDKYNNVLINMPATAGCERLCLDDIEKSVSILLSGRVDYEFRTTVTSQTHETQDIEKIAHWIKGARRYFLQNFADSGDIISSEMTPVSKEEIEKMQQIAGLTLGCVSVR